MRRASRCGLSRDAPTAWCIANEQRIIANEQRAAAEEAATDDVLADTDTAETDELEEFFTKATV